MEKDGRPTAPSSSTLSSPRLMRPALLRLLKRPSALSILDILASTPIGIEQLESQYACLRGQSRGFQQKPPVDDDTLCRKECSAFRRPSNTSRALSFPTYEIELSETNCARPADRPHSKNTKGTGQCDTKGLGLRPEKLQFESDVGHFEDLGTRLVDLPENKNDFGLWEELLRFRQRHDGDKGTLDIWEGMMHRVRGVHLPIVGTRADFFWQTFVDMGLKRELILRDVVKYAVDLCEQTGARWPQMYERVVGGLLDRGKMRQAVEFHKRLQQSHLEHPNDLLRILLPAICSSSSSLLVLPGYVNLSNAERRPASPGVKAFQNMCKTIEGHQIYTPVISTLLRHGFGEDAILMHGFLANREDHPQTYEELQPLLNYARTRGRKQDFRRLKNYAKQRFTSENPSVDPETPTHDSSATISKDGSPQGRPFRDDLAARLFATRALNFDTILVGLQVLGVTEVGPRTLREMAVRAHGGQDILNKIRQLQKAGISVGNSVFSRLIQKLASQNRDILLSDLLQSDQHPDIMEDVRVQESLLVSYYMARDWRQYNMALALLMEIAPDAPDLFDTHFRKYIAAREWGMASHLVDELAVRGKCLSEQSIDFMAAQVLSPRRQHHGPQQRWYLSPHKQLVFVFRILQRVVPAGAYVSAAFWMEMLKRMGMGNYWDELGECSRWLVRQYSHPAKRELEPWARSRLFKFISHPDPQSTDDQSGRILDLIFTPLTQKAIVTWGFKFRLHSGTRAKFYIRHRETGKLLIPWVRGLILLRELERAGLRLHLPSIQHATRMRLAQLFSRYGLSGEPVNRRLRRENPFSLRRVLRDVGHAWGEPSLFSGMEFSNPDGLVNPPRSPSSLRRTAHVRAPRRRRRRIETTRR